MICPLTDEKDGHTMKELQYLNAVYDNIAAASYVQCNQSVSEINMVGSLQNATVEYYTVLTQDIYDQCTYSTKYAIVDQAVSTMTGIYEYDANLHASDYEVAVSIEEEQKIYDTPCDDDEDYGPIYCEPPTEEEKLYAVFEGRKLQKLHHKDIRFQLAKKHSY